MGVTHSPVLRIFGCVPEVVHLRRFCEDFATHSVIRVLGSSGSTWKFHTTNGGKTWKNHQPKHDFCPILFPYLMVKSREKCPCLFANPLWIPMIACQSTKFRSSLFNFLVGLLQIKGGYLHGSGLTGGDVWWHSWDLDPFIQLFVVFKDNSPIQNGKTAPVSGQFKGTILRPLANLNRSQELNRNASPATQTMSPSWGNRGNSNRTDSWTLYHHKSCKLLLKL